MTTCAPLRTICRSGRGGGKCLADTRSLLTFLSIDDASAALAQLLVKSDLGARPQRRLQITKFNLPGVICAFGWGAQKYWALGSVILCCPKGRE